jgi:chemotaxis protein MotB
MSRKKHPEHVNHERWLVSYADFITLLFAFFVVLFASSQSDKKKQSQLAAAMQTAFRPMGTFDAHSKTPALMPGAASSSNAIPSPIQPMLPTSESVSLRAEAQIEKRTRARIEKMLTEDAPLHLPAGSITMKNTSEGLVISVHEAGFFASGSAEIRAQSIALLTGLAACLPVGPLRVEGHTDNVPIHTGQFASNWELSTARAITIARLILGHSLIRPGDLSASGYAEYHPVASNATESGRSQNRRVDIILLRPQAP